MGNLAGYFYLEGRFEEAIKFLQSQNAVGNGLNEKIFKSSTEMLNDCSSALQIWSNSEDLRPFDSDTITRQLRNTTLTNLLDLQLCNKRKTDVSIVWDFQVAESLKLPGLHKLHMKLKNLPPTSDPALDIKREKLETMKMEKMLDAGNMEYVKKWLIEKNVNVNCVISDEDLSSLPLTSIPTTTLKVCADFYAKSLEYRKSVILYNILTESITGSMDSDLANKITSSLSKRIMESEEFFIVFTTESLSHGDRLETIKCLHQVAVQSFPDSAKSWLCYGDFAYSINEKRNNISTADAQLMKYTAVECYGKYLQLSQKQSDVIQNSSTHFTSHAIRTIVMTRLLQLFREGYPFSLEEIITTQDWLILLENMSQIPQLRSYLITKFPEQVSLFLSCHDGLKTKNKTTPRRRNLFDLSLYSYVDTSEEPLSSNVLLSNLSQLEKSGEEKNSTSIDTLMQYQFRSDINIPLSASIFAQELLRLASSMEDMWVWSLERIAVDWGRRLAYLRKECARSLSTEKIQAYIKPVS